MNIGQSAFDGVDIKEIKFPHNLNTIGFAAFAGSTLENLDLGKGVSVILPLAFMNTCVKSVYIPESVDNIGFGAFCGCKELKDIQVAKENSEYYAENGCLIERQSKKLVACIGNTVIPDGVEEIEALTFYGASSNDFITIPESVKKINKYDLDIPVNLEFPMTVIGKKGSYAIEFAKQQGIRYIETE